MPARPALPILFVLAALLAACERPFVDVRSPEIEVVEPDFSRIFLTDQAMLRVRASSFRDVDRVEIGSQPMSFDPQTETWTAPLQFSVGLNIVTVRAFDVEGVFQADTLYALHLIHRIVPTAPSIGEPLGGHTTTRLADGSLLVAGGTHGAGRDAHDRAFLMPFRGTRFEPVAARMQVARTGHTATLLPDGRVLFLGGSTNDDLTDIARLVETPEAYDPVSGRFSRLVVVGDPVRRALHTAILRTTADGPVIDLYGGRGDIQYRPTPRLGTRQDLRSFLVRNDTLFALSPAPGPFIEPVSGHTETPLAFPSGGEVGRFLVAGSFFIDGTADASGFILDYGSPFGLDIIPAATPQLPRRRHSAVLLRPGFVLLLGGRQAERNQVLAVPEVYVASIDRYFRFPDEGEALPSRRFGQTATILSAERILVLGGFSPDGTGAPGAEFFDFDL